MSTRYSGPSSRGHCWPPPDPAIPGRTPRCAGTRTAPDADSESAVTKEANMSNTPGHQKWPEHKVRETPVSERVTVELNGQLIADSRRVIRVDEDGSPARYYFPRGDVTMDKLQRTATTSQCPF